MCYKCFQRMRNAPPTYERCRLLVGSFNRDLKRVDKQLHRLSRFIPAAILADPDYAETLTIHANELCRVKDRLLKRKSMVQEWYYHTFPLYDLLAPTENGASSQ